MSEFELLVVYSYVGEAAACHLEELILNDDELKGEISLVKWGIKQWRDNRFAQQGEVSNPTIFIGNINEVDAMKMIAKIKYKEYGIIYSISGKNVILTSNYKKLNNSQYEYNKYIKALQEKCPNRIRNASFGMDKVKSFVKGGIKQISFTEPNNIQKQQHLYGISIFYEKDLKDFLNACKNI